jgi:prephenate dehydrogenase
MNHNKITIIGLGLIGGSLALALKKAGFKGEITAVGRREGNLARAREMGMIDSFTTVHADGVKGSDMIVLATPIGRFEQIALDIRDSLKTGSVVTDVGSVKTAIVKKLDSIMPKGISFVGAHPIAGKECSGIDAANSDLFINAKCIITPSVDTADHAIEEVIRLWQSVGALILHMSPEEHDLIFAAVSHLPHIIAYALINNIMDVSPNILHFGGTGLKDMSRIALSPADMWRDICAFNRNDVLSVLRKFSSSVTNIIDLFEKSDWSGLEKEFNRAREARKLIESD